jgi:predicted extracellular nuclease
VLVRTGGPRVLARRAALGTVAASLAVVGLPTLARAALPTAPFISEIHYDDSTAAGDTGEFVEVQFPSGTTSSAGWSVVLYNGGNGAVYDTDALGPLSADGVAVVTYPSNGVQNGSPDGVALVNSAGAAVEFLSYEGPMTATGGPASGKTSTDIGVAETNATTPGTSLSRRYNTVTEQLQWFPSDTATPNKANATFTPEPVDVCQTPVTHQIGEVQGSGPVAAQNGRTVTVQGVVVADLPSFQGFYLQDADGDGDTATSDGIFVFSPVPVALGDTVAVSGRVSEYFAQTQISSSRDVSVCATDTPLPAPAPLDLPADDAAREPLEGMVVAPADALTVSEVFDLTSYGELTLAEGGVLVQPTELARPGTPEAAAVETDNTLRRIVLDDGLDSRVSNTTRPYLSPATPVRVGDELAFTSPVVLGYGFGKWRLQPADGTADGTFAAQNTRPAAPDGVGGDVRLGAFNVLNYFITYGGVGRGATSQAQHDRQAAKIVSAIEALGADVVSLLEVEDTDSTGYSPGNADQALADLVGRLNTAAGYDKWSYVPLPDELYAVDRDVIRNGMVYQPAEVQPVGDPVGLVDETVWFNAREPIAQTFSKDGDRFTVVANHFKSKSPGEPTGDNVDTGDGQGQWNGDRRRQAASLAAFTRQLQVSTADQDVISMGDFNAYTEEDPIVDLRQAGYVDLGTEFDPGRYSYVFDDMSGSLDHALATSQLTAKVTGLAHWNINAVESYAYQYVGDPALYAPDPYRSSDHDPLVLGIDLEERCNGLLPTIRGTADDDLIIGGLGRDVIMGLGGDDVVLDVLGNDVICGGTGNDTVFGGVGDDVLLGGYGDDRLSGDPGKDTLIGGPGTDRLYQGPGHGTEEQEGRES